MLKTIIVATLLSVCSFQTMAMKDVESTLIKKIEQKIKKINADKKEVEDTLMRDVWDYLAPDYAKRKYSFEEVLADPTKEKEIYALIKEKEKDVPFSRDRPISIVVKCSQIKMNVLSDILPCLISNNFPIHELHPFISVMAIVMVYEKNPSYYKNLDKSKLLDSIIKNELASLKFLMLSAKLGVYTSDSATYLRFISAYSSSSDIVVKSFATEMAYDLDNNLLVFEEKYLNKVIFVTGQSEGVDRDVFNKFHILLSANGHLPVQAYFEDTEKSKFAKINKGQKVTLVCIPSKEQSFMVKLEGCEIVNDSK